MGNKWPYLLKHRVSKLPDSNLKNGLNALGRRDPENIGHQSGY